MRFYPEFESIHAQLLHCVSPPTLEDALALVVAEETQLCAMSDPYPPAPHLVLALP